MRASVNQTLQSIDRLLDIGNGGVFDYDTNIVRSIVALDLFLDGLPPDTFPVNVTLKAGSALAIPEPDASFDGVLLVMLIHHLVGKTVGESLCNVRLAVREAFRVLRPGGKLIILESCVPQWFYLFEKMVFPLASAAITLILPHPATLQYPAALIAKIVQEHDPDIEVVRIPKGQWILQYGFKFPAALTPVSPYRFVAPKRDAALRLAAAGLGYPLPRFSGRRAKGGQERRDRLFFRPLDKPTLTGLPNGDTRPLLVVGVRGLKVVGFETPRH